MEWVFLILFCAFLIAIKHILAKNCLSVEHTNATVFWTSALLSIGCLFVFNSQIDFFLPYKTLFLIILKSVILAAAWHFFYHALKRLHISLVEPITNLSPAILMVLSFFILGERLGLMQYLGVGVIMGGAFLLSVEHINKPFHSFKLFKNKEVVYLMIFVVLASLCAILDKVIVSATNLPTIIFYTFFFVAVCYLLTIIHNGHLNDITHPIKQHYYLVLLIALLAFISDWFYFTVVAMPLVPISLIIPMKRLSSLISTVLGGRMFKESNLFHKAVACCVMIFGVFLVV
jgi:uncharacterized membrane protein